MSSEQIIVTVINYGRKYLYMRYRDPTTGKVVAKSTGKTTKKEAERIAAAWENDLRSGKHKSASKITWKEFRDRYESEVLSSLKDSTALKVSGVFNALEELIGIDKLAKLDANQLSRLQSKLRDEKKLAESTIKGHLAHLKAALNWAKTVNLISEVPAITMPKRAKSGKMMKGRPITAEEFERMLAKVSEVIDTAGIAKDEANQGEKDTEVVARWKWYLRGLYFSGLRISESLNFYWDRHDKLTVDLSGKFPMLLIPAELEKGNKDRLMPLAPEFAEMLLSVPEDERTGPIFKLGRRESGNTLQRVWVSNLVSAIGKAANVKVNTDIRTKAVKFASAHDLRRSFGVRWSARMMPNDLMEMMRHESIETTMKYYVGRNADTVAEKMYEAFHHKTDQQNAKTAASEVPNNTPNIIHQDATSKDALGDS
jgi:integrase